MKYTYGFKVKVPITQALIKLRPEIVEENGYKYAHKLMQIIVRKNKKQEMRVGYVF